MTFYTLQVTSEMAELTYVLSWFESICSPQLTVTDFQQLEIVIAEAFTNTVKYAHGHLSSATPIVLDLLLDRDWVEIRLWDQGKPFDFDRYLHQELQQTSPEQSLRQHGHRGLLLMKRLTDDLFYEQSQHHQNCLVMRKRLASCTVSR